MKSLSVGIRNIIWITIGGVLSLLASWGIAQYGLDFRTLLFFVLLIAAVIMILSGRKALRFGFVIWIWMFILGYRTIHLTSDLSLHPLLVFLVFLFLILLWSIKSETIHRIKIPGMLWVFSVFWIWGFIPGVLNNQPWPTMISDALNFFMLLPLFWVILYLAREPGFWKLATFTFLGTGVLICLLGTIEFYSPAFRNLLPGFIQTNSEGMARATGFTRASFAFFGANPAVLISALALPMVWLLPKYYKSRWAGLFSLILLAILGTGIYISGTRAAWLMVFCASLLLAYLGLKWVGLGLTAIFWWLVSHFLSPEAWNQIYSLITPLTSGQILDSSLEKRALRQQDAFQLAIQNPFGVGWSGSGWVHGDFTQVAANLGLLAGVIFLLWYLLTLYQAWKLYRKYPQDRLLQALMTAFVLCGIVLATEGVQVLTQLAMPVWFVWGLMEAYLQHSRSKDFIT